jgi:L,D-transpeptidase YcbB
MIQERFSLSQRRKINRCILFSFFFWTVFPIQAAQTFENHDVAFEIRNLFEVHGGDGNWLVGSTRGFHFGQGLAFYSNRRFRELWIEDGKLTCIAYQMRYEIQQSKFDGLDPRDYHLEYINHQFEAMEKASRGLGAPLTALELAKLDILLTDAFFELATHIYQGKIDSSHREYGWEIQRKEPKKEVVTKLKLAIESGSIRRGIEALYPGFPMYGRMRRSIMDLYAKQKEMPRQWQKLSVAKSIKPLESHAAVPLIRERVGFWEDNILQPTEAYDLYDSALLAQVRAFQSKHGLNPDGVIGNATVRALNKTPVDFIRQASVNMERLRWLPDTVVSEVILVNIANFSLDYIRNRDTLLHSNAIVGKAYRKTPVFNAPMTYLVFSPTWTVPPTILRNDVIPAIKRDVGYLASKNMRLLTYSGQQVDPNTINWNKISINNFPYMIRQDPGPNNSLGWVKFMFPNTHNVYIHDTPSRELFARDDRALSSGCIRIQKPLELAKLLLADQPLWSHDRITASMYSRKEQTVMLNRKIPVVLLYLTFWTDSRGIPMFRHDIYERDVELYNALQSKIPLRPGV